MLLEVLGMFSWKQVGTTALPTCERPVLQVSSLCLLLRLLGNFILEGAIHEITKLTTGGVQWYIPTRKFGESKVDVSRRLGTPRFRRRKEIPCGKEGELCSPQTQIWCLQPQPWGEKRNNGPSEKRMKREEKANSYKAPLPSSNPP